MVCIRYLLIVLIVLTSCSGNEKRVGGFSRYDFKDSVSIKGEPIGFNPNPDGVLYYVLRDTLLFVNTMHGNPYYMEVYGLNSGKEIYKFARRGNGPNEFLGCYLRYSSNEDSLLYLFDIVTKKATSYNIDSLMKMKDKYVPRQIQLPDYLNNIGYYDKNELIGYNFYHFESPEFKNDAECLVKVRNIKNGRSGVQSKESRYFTANVSWCGLFKSPVNNQIWVADYYKDKIDIYDDRLMKVKTLSGPDQINPQYTVRENNHVSFSNHKQYSGYYSGFYNKRSIYLLYQGVNGIPGNQDYHKPVEVFKFSWNGDLVCRYQLDRWVNTITIDSKEKYIYGSAEGVDGMGQLVRFRM